MIALLVTSATCRSSPSLLVYQKGVDPHRTQGQLGSVPHWSHLKACFGFGSGSPPRPHNHSDGPHGPECLISAAQPLLSAVLASRYLLDCWGVWAAEAGAVGVSLECVWILIHLGLWKYGSLLRALLRALPRSRAREWLYSRSSGLLLHLCISFRK